MKIYDKNNNLIENPDLEKGRLIPDRKLLKHYEAIKPVEEQWHYEVAKVYPNGGKDLVKVIDVEGVTAKEAWDEYEDIQRYIPYTQEELEEMSKPSEIEILKEQIAQLQADKIAMENAYYRGVNEAV